MWEWCEPCKTVVKAIIDQLQRYGMIVWAIGQLSSLSSPTSRARAYYIVGSYLSMCHIPGWFASQPRGQTWRPLALDDFACWGRSQRSSRHSGLGLHRPPDSGRAVVPAQTHECSPHHCTQRRDIEIDKHVRDYSLQYIRVSWKKVASTKGLNSILKIL